MNDGEIDEVKLVQTYRLARTVFEPEIADAQQGIIPPNHRNLNLELWRQKLSIPNANILYATDLAVPTAGRSIHADDKTAKEQRSQVTPTEVAAGGLVGMFFNFPRERDGLIFYHIFLSAIHPTARGQGLFTMLLDATKNFAKHAGYDTLTVSTFPNRFHRMFSILSKEGSGWEILEWQDKADPEKKKVVMRMVLD